MVYKKTRRRPTEHVRRVNTRKGIKVVQINKGLRHVKTKRAKSRTKPAKKDRVMPMKGSYERVGPSTDDKGPVSKAHDLFEEIQSVDLLKGTESLIDDYSKKQLENKRADMLTDPEFYPLIFRYGDDEVLKRIQKSNSELEKQELKEKFTRDWVERHGPTLTSLKPSASEDVPDHIVRKISKETGLSYDDAMELITDIKKGHYQELLERGSLD